MDRPQWKQDISAIVVLRKCFFQLVKIIDCVNKTDLELTFFLIEFHKEK